MPARPRMHFYNGLVARWLNLIPLAIAAILTLGSPARADDVDDCTQQTDMDLSIKGCTAMIESGTYSKQITAASYVLRGLAYSQKQQFDRAVADYTSAIKLNPKSAEAYNNRGAAFLKLNRFDLAEKDIRKALALDPGYALAKQNLAKLPKKIPDAQAGSTPEAPAPTPAPNAKTNGWKDCSQDKDNELALRGCAAVIADPKSTKPHRADAYYNRGNAYYRDNKFDEAISDYGHAIELNPRFTNAYFNRSRGYEKKKQTAPAIADLNSVIKLTPKDAEAYASRGRLLEEQGELKKAALDYRKALKIDPRNAEAKMLLEYVKEDIEDASSGN